MKKKQKDRTRPVGWNKADGCTDNITEMAKKHFGKAKVSEWMLFLTDHVSRREDFTGYEGWMYDTFRNAADAGLAMMFFEEIVARCLRTVIEPEDDEDYDGDGAPPQRWNAESLKGFTFHNAKLEVRPKGNAVVTYMGETLIPEVHGMIGINCTIHLDGTPHIKPTVVFVSKPFHQYRAVQMLE